MVCRRLLANVALATVVGAQPGTHVGRALLELVFADLRRQAVEMHLAALAYPEDVAALGVLAGSEQLSQFIGSRLIVQIHGMSP
ncbi:hypothetical protein D3C81_2156810 [compost metagenome]